MHVLTSTLLRLLYYYLLYWMQFTYFPPIRQRVHLSHLDAYRVQSTLRQHVRTRFPRCQLTSECKQSTRRRPAAARSLDVRPRTRTRGRGWQQQRPWYLRSTIHLVPVDIVMTFCII